MITKSNLVFVECTEISTKKQALANIHYRVNHVPVFKRSKA